MVQPVEQVDRQRQPGEVSAIRLLTTHIRQAHSGRVDPKCDDCLRLSKIANFVIRPEDSIIPRSENP